MNFKQRINEIDQEINALDKERMTTFTYNPKRNQEFMGRIVKLNQEKRELIQRMEENK